VSETVKVNTIGSRVFGDPSGDYDKDVNANDIPYLMQVFEDLSTALGNDDSEAIQSAIDNLQLSHEQVLSVRAEVGAKMNRLELTQNKLATQVNNVKELLSYNEDVDLVEVIMNIGMAENVYTSSLMTGAKIIQPSLVQFLS